MTIVIGVVEGTQVWMGSDSLASDDVQAFVLQRPKLFCRRVGKRPLLMGLSGSVRIAQIAECLSLPKAGRKVDAYLFMLEMAEALRLALRDKGAGGETNGEQWGEFTLMAAFAGRLFIVQSDYSVLERCPYAAIGSGELYALGSLHATRDSGLRPETRLLEALAAAEHFDPHCRRPFYVRVCVHHA